MSTRYDLRKNLKTGVHYLVDVTDANGLPDDILAAAWQALTFLGAESIAFADDDPAELLELDIPLASPTADEKLPVWMVATTAVTGADFKALAADLSSDGFKVAGAFAGGHRPVKGAKTEHVGYVGVMAPAEDPEREAATDLVLKAAGLPAPRVDNRSRNMQPGQDIEILERRVKVVSLRKSGASFHQIAVTLGMGKSQAWRDYTAEMQERQVELTEAAESLRALELERLDAMQMAIWTRASLHGDDRAIDRVLRIQERRAKLAGLDAPDRRLTITGDIGDLELMTDLQLLAIAKGEVGEEDREVIDVPVSPDRAAAQS